MGTKRSICLQYHRWPLFRGFHKADFHCIWEWALPRRFTTLLLNLLHGVTLYQAQNYSTCTYLPPQMTPIKPAFEPQNYFCLSGYVSTWKYKPNSSQQYWGGLFHYEAMIISSPKRLTWTVGLILEGVKFSQNLALHATDRFQKQKQICCHSDVLQLYYYPSQIMQYQNKEFSGRWFLTKLHHSPTE